MKREKLMSALWTGVLAFCIGFGVVACMATGLNLPVQWNSLALGCVVAAVAAAVCFSVKRAWLAYAQLALLFFSERFWIQLESLCSSVMTYLNLGYGIPYPGWLNKQMADVPQLPLLLIAALVMAAVGWTILHKKRSFLALAAALIPLSTCLFVVNTVPQNFAIFLLLAGLVLLMLTQTLRRQDAAQANSLTAMLILPVAAALVLLFCIVPRSNYNAPMKVDALLDWVVDVLPFVERTADGNTVLSVGGLNSDRVSLSDAGERNLPNTPVLEVSTDHSGTLYLRGQDYDLYNGVSWTASEDRAENFGATEGWTSGLTYTMEAKFLTYHEQHYVPYYPADELILKNGSVPSGSFQKIYSYDYRVLWENWENIWQDRNNTEDGVDLPAAAVDERYLRLPESTGQKASAYVTFILLDAKPQNDLQMAQAIGEYVRNSAKYDLQTARMPGSESDFAIWFLESSETGYCVHFASAATVLLRTAGIPARYVEGYTVNVEANKTTVVRGTMAHAWVEYYLDGVGWVILEATPGAEEIPEETTQPTQPTTEPTQPTTTEPTQSTTQPAETTTNPPQSSTEDSTGGTGSSGEYEEELPNEKIIALLWMLIGITGAAGLIVGQWVLRRCRKKRQMYRGKANQQALARYREAQRLARLRKISMPEELVALAQKAKFSNHVLTQEELAKFDGFVNSSVAALYRKGWYWRLLLRFVFAVC